METYEGKLVLGEKISHPRSLSKKTYVFDYGIIKIEDVWYDVTMYRNHLKRGTKYYYRLKKGRNYEN